MRRYEIRVPLPRNPSQNERGGRLRLSAAASAGIDERSRRRVGTIRRRTYGGARTGGRGGGASSPASGGAGTLQFDTVAFQASGVSDGSGPEGDIVAFRLAVFNTRLRIASATSATTTAAFDAASQAGAVLPEGENAVAASEETAAAASAGYDRHGSPQSCDAGARRDFALPNGNLRAQFHGPRANRDAGRRQSGRTGLHGDVSRRFGGLNDCHAQAVERLARAGDVGFVAGGGAVPDAHYPAPVGGPGS